MFTTLRNGRLAASMALIVAIQLGSAASHVDGSQMPPGEDTIFGCRTVLILGIGSGATAQEAIDKAQADADTEVAVEILLTEMWYGEVISVSIVEVPTTRIFFDAHTQKWIAVIKLKVEICYGLRGLPDPDPEVDPIN